MDTNALILSIAVAIAAGLVGCVAVMRRMTLAADALSHVALPGIGVALVLRIHPMFGAVTMLVLGALLVWAIERQTRISAETITGVVFSAALAVGSMLSTGEELIDALFGGPGTLATWELGVGLVMAAAIIVLMMKLRSRLVLSLVSPEIGHTSGIAVSKLNMLYLVIFAVTVSLGLRYLGVLLMGSLIIIPAATARRLARNLNELFIFAVIVAVLATVAGFVLAPVLGQKAGPLTVSVAAAFFAASLILPARR